MCLYWGAGWREGRGHTSAHVTWSDRGRQAIIGSQGKAIVFRTGEAVCCLNTDTAEAAGLTPIRVFAIFPCPWSVSLIFRGTASIHGWSSPRCSLHETPVKEVFGQHLYPTPIFAPKPCLHPSPTRWHERVIQPGDMKGSHDARCHTWGSYLGWTADIRPLLDFYFSPF